MDIKRVESWAVINDELNMTFKKGIGSLAIYKESLVRFRYTENTVFATEVSFILSPGLETTVFSVSYIVGKTKRYFCIFPQRSALKSG